MTVKQVSLHVETLRCEAPEAEVVEQLLSQKGVVEADVDFDEERVRVAFDPDVTSADTLAEALDFFGLTVQGDPSRRAAA